MMLLTPRDPKWEQRVRQSFANQPFMAHLGARLSHVAPGAVDIELPLKPALTQQHGFFHAGTTTSIADSAAGYAALSLFPADSGVLSSEFKVNLLNPAKAPVLVARGRVIKSGKTLSIARADVYGLEDSGQVHVLTGLFTLMCMAGMKD